MAIMGSNLANVASRAVTSGNSQFGSDTPWARTIANTRSGQNSIDIAPGENVSQRMINRVPVGVTAPTGPATPAWSLEGDPLYQSALAAGRSAFSFAQAQALSDKQNQETAANQQRRSLDTSAAEGRRRLAGNYAARGMAGGAAGALTMAEARANAEQVAARTSITDQLTALNNQYLQNFGDASAPGYDWTGTLTGQQYKTQAAQAAIQAQLARYGAA